MSEPAKLVKNILGQQAIFNIAQAGQRVSSTFNSEQFIAAALDGIDELSIMQRVRHIADVLAKVLPNPYTDAVSLLCKMLPHISPGFQAVALSEYVARYGQEDFDTSMQALSTMTRYGSAEFSIRPFLLNQPSRTISILLQWAHSDDEHLRRLASEGCRPRLPWAMKLTNMLQMPSPAMEILEQLKSDPSLYVRKSVANHLNDLAKTYPEAVLDWLTTWPIDDPHVKWVIRHALRNLIKQGNQRALALLGVDHLAKLEVTQLKLSPTTIRQGESLTISLTLASQDTDKQSAVVDYRLHFPKANGSMSIKVFKLKTFTIQAEQTVDMVTTRAFKDLSTRKYRTGRYSIDILVNGNLAQSASFELIS